MGVDAPGAGLRASGGGVVYLVATPLGNLEDITLRALRILREVDLIACEDTRHTRRLLEHYSIRTPVISCHEHNEAARSRRIAAMALQGQSIALVSDAGTPGICDPGFRVVRQALENGVRVVPVPGPCAAIAALTASGLPTHSFRFRGYLPPRRTRRRKALQSIRSTEDTTVFFESPRRILDALTDLGELLEGRPLAVARELTKVYEEVLRGSARAIRQDLESRDAVRGEFVVVVGPGHQQEGPEGRSLATRVSELEASGLRRMDAIKQAARELHIGKREAYSRLHQSEQAGGPDQLPGS